MSLARACLRMAAVAALRGRTLAELRVFDSRIGSIDGLTPEARKAVVAVYTEDQAGEALSRQNGGPPFRPHVDLTFEISMVEAQFDDAAVITDIGCPTTDDELEAALDTLEAQIVVVLFEDVTAPLSVLFRRAFLHGHSYQSLRFREEKAGARLAYRYIIIKLEIADEPVLTGYDTPAVGLDRLPATFRGIAHAWPDDLPEKAKALAMAAALPQPTIARGITLAMQDKVGGSTIAGVAAAGGNVGNGTLTPGAVDPAARPGAYVVRLASATAFVVVGPDGRSWPGLVGEPFGGPVPFGVAAGSSPFAAGDAFTVTVAATGLFAPVDLPPETSPPTGNA